jgi:hypothetical protein
VPGLDEDDGAAPGGATLVGEGERGEFRGEIAIGGSTGRGKDKGKLCSKL